MNGETFMQKSVNKHNTLTSSQTETLGFQSKNCTLVLNNIYDKKKYVETVTLNSCRGCKISSHRYVY